LSLIFVTAENRKLKNHEKQEKPRDLNVTYGDTDDRIGGAGSGSDQPGSTEKREAGARGENEGDGDAVEKAAVGARAKDD